LIAPADLRIDGDGPENVVLLHGWPDTLALWDKQVEALQGRYRCVRFTLPGFSGAPLQRVPSLDELMQMLAQAIEATCGDAPVTLVLHDWGCVFGYEYAMRHPTRVRRIVAADIGDAGSRAHVASLSLPAKLGMLGYQRWLALAWRTGGRLGDLMTRRLVGAMHVPEPQRVHAGLNWPYQLQAEGGLKRMHPVNPRCPLLFLYGRRKPFMFHSPTWADAVAQRPGCAVHGLDAGHWLMLSRADEFNEQMLRWLAAAPPG